MPSWGARGRPMTTRRVRGRIKMLPFSHSSTFSLILLSFSVLLLSASVNGQECVGNCTAPLLFGGGTPAFTPDQTCYAGGASVNASCPGGYLYGDPVIEPCFYEEPIGYWAITPYPACEVSSCGTPSTPTGGSFSPPSASDLYDEITYSCDSGLYLDGPSMAVCTGTGQWSPVAPPACSGNCTVPVITNGEVTLIDDGLHEGVEIALECDSGFTLTGPDNLTCRDLNWSPDVSDCLANCDSPDIFNSNYSMDQGSTDHGEYIIVACDDGYSSGEGEYILEPMTCGNSTWEGDVHCYQNCNSSTIEIPEFGHVVNETSTTYYHGNIAVFRCDDTYTLVGDAYTTCNDSNWSTVNVPVCKAPCVIPNINNSNLQDEYGNTTVTHGTNINVTCLDGYDFHNDSPFDGVLTCVDGTIDQTGSECRVTCDSPDVSDSNWAPELDRGHTRYGGSIVVDCDEGFTSGSGSDINKTLSCSEGVWDGTVTCFANCPETMNDTGLVMYPSAGPFYHTNTVYFNCSNYDFYKFRGNETLTCDDGNWTDPYPVCRDSCLHPTIEHSNYANDDPVKLVYPDDEIIVVCDDGYTSGNGPDINETIYCEDRFFNREVFCYENCYNVTSPMNGSFTDFPNYYHGDKVNFTCDEGYTIDGNETITCLDGEWSSEFPTCELDCTDPGTPANGVQLSSDLYKHGTDVEYGCNEGLDILGARVITCEAGEWSDPVPHCINETLVDQITLTCHHDSYTVTIPVVLLGNLTVDNVAIGGDSNCTGSINGSLLYLTSKLDECRTVLSEDNNATHAYYDVFSNTVVDIGDHTGPSVDIPLKCTYNREGEFDALSYQLNQYDISTSLSQSGQFQYTFDIFNNSSYTYIEEYSPHYVGLNEEVYFGISVIAAADTLRVQAQSCWATPTSSASHSTRWDLITASCPNDPTLTITEDDTRSLFSVASFRFNEEGGVVYIHCDVLVCKYESTQCDLDCGGGGSRRRKRSTSYVNPNRIQRLRVGPITWVESEEQIPEIIKRDVSMRNEEDSPFIYIIVIASLACMCIFLVASLAVVTSKLVNVSRYHSKTPRQS